MTDIPVTRGWKFVSIGFEGDEILINGLDPWRSEWHSIQEKPIVVAHPSYPEQRHTMWVYELRENGKVIKFAAGEFSNGVWGIYVPE
jgi:hypothetical protein